MFDDSPEKRAEEWKELRERAQREYKSDVKLDMQTCDKRQELSRLVERLSRVSVETAFIGRTGSKARARVFRPGEPEIEIYDTGECLKKTMSDRLGRFLSQQIQLESMRIANG